MNNARVERMLRELHAEPPLRFLEALFSLDEVAASTIAASRDDAPIAEAVAAAQ